MIYISLGSNLGHRLASLNKAVALLKERYLTNVTCSIVLETESILPDGAPLEWNKPFLNMIVGGQCDLYPEDLFQGLKQIEYEMGRPKAYERWSPRLIDLDILLWDDFVINTPHLTIPHPELNNRPFLLHLLKMMDPTRDHKTTPTEDSFSQTFVLSPQLVGVVNLTPDSFSDGGLYEERERAVTQALKLSSEGASIVELGAQSTRPGAHIHSPEEEFKRLKPVLDDLSPSMKEGSLAISIDTFWPKVIRKVLEQYSVAWINDVKGDLDDATLKLIASHQCSLVIMHSLGIPPQKNRVIPDNSSLTDTISQWAEKRIERLLRMGFSQDSIIIDPGIGFGKSASQSLSLLRDVESLKKWGCKILVGHSRKSFMASFTKAEAADRDIETIAISALLQHKVNFLRVHNVAHHMRFFVAQASLKGGTS